MKISYFYASKPDIEYPEIKTITPSSPIMGIEAGEFPKEIFLALNFAFVGVEEVETYSARIEIFFNDKFVSSGNETYEPFRFMQLASSDGMLADRYSVIESFMAKSEGVYTFKIYLFDKEEPDLSKLSDAIDKSECSVAVSRMWR